MPACNPTSHHSSALQTLHEPNPGDWTNLTPEQASLYIQIVAMGMKMIRDDYSFEAARQIFGQQISLDKNADEYNYVRPELPDIIFSVRLTKSKNGTSDSVERLYVDVTRRLCGIKKTELEDKLELEKSSNYVAINLDRQSSVDFEYEAGMDQVSCYPVTVLLNYFKNEIYSATDPRADREAKFLGPVLIERDYMTPAEKAERARRVPQCRSRQPTPRSGLWRPSIPQDAPYAAYFRKQESLSYRVKKGEPMLEVGMDPGSEGRVLWTWVGE